MLVNECQEQRTAASSLAAGLPPLGVLAAPAASDTLVSFPKAAAVAAAGATPVEGPPKAAAAAAGERVAAAADGDAVAGTAEVLEMLLSSSKVAQTVLLVLGAGAAA